jgi:hypothetical protein
VARGRDIPSTRAMVYSTNVPSESDSLTHAMHGCPYMPPSIVQEPLDAAAAAAAAAAMTQTDRRDLLLERRKEQTAADTAHAAAAATPAAASSPPYRLRDGCTLHMYTSAMPCGDAAIYALAASGATGEQNKFTGAKAADGQWGAERGPQQTLGCARTKPGRSDVPPPRRTLSMSCTDKVNHSPPQLPYELWQCALSAQAATPLPW